MPDHAGCFLENIARLLRQTGNGRLSPNLIRSQARRFGANRLACLRAMMLGCDVGSTLCAEPRRRHHLATM